jgi:hypothetical protein
LGKVFLVDVALAVWSAVVAFIEMGTRSPTALVAQAIAITRAWYSIQMETEVVARASSF